jgi:succinate dehydrogenase flavin-adding protein (antitoxin of CptAB toxin-antitoxin module)
MYNYADENTWSKSDKTLEKVISALEEDSNSLINWFSANKMQANPEKFQAISIGRKIHDLIVMFNLNGINLSCEDEVKYTRCNHRF